MAIIKSYTDIEQSKKLAEILPLESADYTRLGKIEDNVLTRPYLESCSSELKGWIGKDEMYPCWSLAALLGVLPEYNLQKTDWGNKIEYKIVVTIDEDNYASKNYGNPIDACYDMILKLHELNLL